MLAGSVQPGAEPFEARIKVEEPIASLDKAEDPVAYNRSPAVYEDCPVPP
jgi:hypothetical protein